MICTTKVFQPARIAYATIYARGLFLSPCLFGPLRLCNVNHQIRSARDARADRETTTPKNAEGPLPVRSDFGADAGRCCPASCGQRALLNRLKSHLENTPDACVIFLRIRPSAYKAYLLPMRSWRERGFSSKTLLSATVSWATENVMPDDDDHCCSAKRKPQRSPN